MTGGLPGGGGLALAWKEGGGPGEGAAGTFGTTPPWPPSPSLLPMNNPGRYEGLEMLKTMSHNWGPMVRPQAGQAPPSGPSPPLPHSGPAFSLDASHLPLLSPTPPGLVFRSHHLAAALGSLSGTPEGETMMGPQYLGCWPGGRRPTCFR